MKSNRWIQILLITAMVLSGGSAVLYAIQSFAYSGGLQQVSSKPLDDLHFVLIPQETDNDYWRMVEKGARLAEQEENVVLEYNGPNKTSVAEHIEWIEKAIASRVDGIITQGLQDEVFRPVINKAIAKGIPVITIDTDSPSSDRSVYVGTDNYEAGYLAGQAMIKDMDKKLKVGIITGSFSARNMILRVQGFKDAVKNETDIEIVAIKESDITRIQAAEKTVQIVKKHPEVNAFFGTSALDSFGIVSTLQQLGRIDHTYIMAFDTLPETLELISQDKIDATVVQYPFEMGYQSVKLMKQLSNGEDLEPIHHTKTSILRKKDLSTLVNRKGAAHE